MRGDCYFIDAGYSLPQRADARAIFLGHAVTDSIGNVDGGCAGCDHRFDHLAKKRDVGTGSIFRREFHVGAERFGVPNRFPRLLQALLTGDAQLIFQMDVRGCENNVDARMRCSPQCLPSAVNVAGASTSESSNDGTPQRVGDTLYGFEVAVGGNRESGLDHVLAEAVELLG